MRSRSTRAADPPAAGYDRNWWWDSAACREADPEIFFPIGPAADTRQARQLCVGCPVRRPCLRYALSTGQEFGVWGGYDESERRALRYVWRHTGDLPPDYKKEMPPWFR